MKPEIKEYKILYLNGAYFVLDPYDLHAMPCLKISGQGFHDLKNAIEKKIKLFETHENQYERLKSLGRSFPDND